MWTIECIFFAGLQMTIFCKLIRHRNWARTGSLDSPIAGVGLVITNTTIVLPQQTKCGRLRLSTETESSLLSWGEAMIFMGVIITEKNWKKIWLQQIVTLSDMFSVVRNSSAETEPIWTIDWECQTLILWRLIPSEPLSRTRSSFSILESWVSGACASSQPFFSSENLKRELLGSLLEKLTWRCCPWRLLVGDAAVSRRQAVPPHFSISSCSQ